MKKYRILAFISALLLFNIYVAVPGVSAMGVHPSRSMSSTDWGYWYLEEQCGVDTSQISSTDYGLTLEEIAKKYGSVTVENAIQGVSNQLQNPFNFDSTAEYFKTYYHNTVVTAGDVASYLEQKAQRTYNDLFNVSGSDFWDSIYNKWFNNDSYKDQYTEDETTKSYMTPDGMAVTFTVVGASKGARFYSSYVPSPFTYAMGNASLNIAPGSDFENNLTRTYIHAIFTVNGVSNDVYIARSYERNVTITYNNVSTWVINWGDAYTSYIYCNGHTFESTSVPILQPSSMGCVVRPDGSIVPVYTDKNLNDFTINPDGTVTFPDGSTSDIFINPDELTPDGWAEFIDFLTHDVYPYAPYTPWGTPWDYNLPSDGAGGFDLTGLGQMFYGILSDLFKGLGDIFSGILSGIGELIQGLIELLSGFVDILSDIFSLDWLFNLDFNIDLDFSSMFDEIINSFLGLYGLEE